MTADATGAAPRPGRGFALANGGRAFRHRNYRLFFGGQLVSLVGTWMQQVAQAWLVLDLTNDPFILGLATALAFLPVLVLGLFGGLIADALPKRPTLIATQAVQMALAFILFGLSVTDTVQVWHILVLATILGHHERRGHADPPGVHRRDGRSRGRAQRRSPSTARSSTARGSSGRPSPGSRSACSAATSARRSSSTA